MSESAPVYWEGLYWEGFDPEKIGAISLANATAEADKHLDDILQKCRKILLEDITDQYRPKIEDFFVTIEEEQQLGDGKTTDNKKLFSYLPNLTKQTTYLPVRVVAEIKGGKHNFFTKSTLKTYPPPSTPSELYYRGKFGYWVDVCRRWVVAGSLDGYWIMR